MALVFATVLLVLILIAVRILFALVGTALFIALTAGDIPFLILPQQLMAGMDSFPMLAVPLFILAGSIMDVGGIAGRLVTLASALVGRLPGGLGHVVVGAEVFLGGVSGSTSAQTAAIGGIMIPQLVVKGYTRERATAITGAACAMGIMMPPTIVLIIYGVIANASIGRLFIAAIVPGLLMALALMIMIWIQARSQQWPRGEWPGWRETCRAGLDSILPLLLMIVIIGGIYYGLFTATEAAAVAVAYSVLLAALVYRSLSWQALWDKLVETAILTGMVLSIVGAAQALSWVLAHEQIPQMIASSVTELGSGQIGFLMLTVLIFLPFGAVLEGVPAVVMLTPILAPIAREYGIDMVHYGVIICATQGISVFMPPIGISLLVACSVGHTTPGAVARPLLPYLGLLLALTLVLAVFPQIALFLPNLLSP